VLEFYYQLIRPGYRKDCCTEKLLSSRYPNVNNRLATKTTPDTKANFIFSFALREQLNRNPS